MLQAAESASTLITLCDSRSHVKWTPAPVPTPPHRPQPCLLVAQGDLMWEAQRTGNTAADWPLLHSVSCNSPDVFWAAVLQQLQLQFVTPPSRLLRDDPQNPDQARWLPGESDVNDMLMALLITC